MEGDYLKHISDIQSLFGRSIQNLCFNGLQYFSALILIMILIGSLKLKCLLGEYNV